MKISHSHFTHSNSTIEKCGGELRQNEAAFVTTTYLRIYSVTYFLIALDVDILLLKCKYNNQSKNLIK